MADTYGINSEFATLRQKYMPNKVEILFVGESCPRQGTFFYCKNSNLYRHTENAFNAADKKFSLEYFAQYGCWLYDICDIPVNGLLPVARREQIRLGLPNLLRTIDVLSPQYVITVKKGDMKEAHKAICKTGDYTNQVTAFNLPFPACGNQKKYEKELAEVLLNIL